MLSECSADGWGGGGGRGRAFGFREMSDAPNSAQGHGDCYRRCDCCHPYDHQSWPDQGPEDVVRI